MTNHCQIAYSRLAVLIVLGGLLMALACRPAWSPDGRRLLYLAPPGGGRDHMSVAVYDRDTGVASMLTDTPIETDLVALAWSNDSSTAVVISRNKSHDTLSVRAYAVPAKGPPKTFQIESVASTPEVFFVPPVVVGSQLFLSVDGIARIDLESGEQKRSPAPKKRALIVFARGDGLAYLSIAKGEQEADWELGTVDPRTLETTTLIKAPKALGWQAKPLPAFSRDLSRVAMPASRGKGNEEQAILIFHDAELETVLPIGREQEVNIGSVEWANDGVTVLVSVCRPGNGEQPDAWGLYETTISGSVTRETVVVRSAHSKKDDGLGMMFPMALSPDGKTAAFSTAMIKGVDDDAAGLYLIDLSSKDRKTVRVPFPAMK